MQDACMKRKKNKYIAKKTDRLDMVYLF